MFYLFSRLEPLLSHLVLSDSGKEKLYLKGRTNKDKGQEGPAICHDWLEVRGK